MVGVEGLEAGLGRAVKGAGDTESVVQNLQLRQQNTEARQGRGRAGEGESGERKKKVKAQKRKKKNKKTKTKGHQ